MCGYKRGYSRDLLPCYQAIEETLGESLRRAEGSPRAEGPRAEGPNESESEGLPTSSGPARSLGDSARASVCDLALEALQLACMRSASPNASHMLLAALYG